MELVWISTIFSSILIPYYVLTRKEDIRLQKIERDSQALYGSSPWAEAGSYTGTSANLDFSTGSGWFGKPEPLSEPVPEPDISHPEPDKGYSEPPPEPDKSYSEPDISHGEDWAPSDVQLLPRIVEHGQFNPIKFPLDLLDHPQLKSLIELVLILRAFKEKGLSLNVVSGQLQIKKGASKTFRLINLIWNML
jgi:hypothetical protein